MSSLASLLIDRYVPKEARQEAVIHLGLYAVLSWGMDKSEKLDWERLTLGPKSGVPPPSPLISTFGYNRAAVFGFLAVLCMTPRLCMPSRGIMANSGDNFSGTVGWRSGLVWALIQHYPKMLFPLWGQWICYLYTYFHISPTPTSLAGFECLSLSILGCILAMPPVLIFAIYRVSDTIIHPLLRSWARNSQDSGVVQKERAAVIWFLRLYVLLLVPEKHFPILCARLYSWSFWALVVFGLTLYPLFTVWDNARYLPESSCSPSYQGSANEFRYVPLAGKSHIRLLRVLSSFRNDEAVACQLIQVTLDDNPSYNAISYRWQTTNQDSGTSETTRMETITVNGFGYAVYPNVLAILQDVRSRFIMQHIWIDSICIDQNNLAEKEIQVSMMRQIYTGSLNVIIHLAEPGPPYRDVSGIEHLVVNLRNSRVLQDYSYQDKPGELLSLGTHSDWNALESLLDDSWFVRVWIVQEVAVARRVRLRLRGKEIQWGDFVRACAVLSRTGMRAYVHYRYMIEGRQPPTDRISGTGMAGVESTLVLDNLRQWYSSGQLLPLLDTMILCLRFKSTWEVDKLYAMLGIIDPMDRERLGISPDYTRNKSTVFRALACKLLQSASLDDQFRILRFAGIGQTRNIDCLPSWVPDWTAGLPACSLESREEKTNYKASTTKHAKRMQVTQHSNIAQQPRSSAMSDHLGTHLEISGCVVDRITLLCDVSTTPSPENVTDFPIGDALAAVRSHDPAREMYRSTLQPIDEAFWRTLIAIPSMRHRPATNEGLKVWTHYFRAYEAARSGRGRMELFPDSAQDEESWELRRTFAAIWFWQADDEDLRFAHILAADLSKRWPEHRHVLGASSILNRPLDHMEAMDPRMSAGRQFCVTEKGYFGLVPRLTVMGDIVVLFDGAKTPHVIRPSKESVCGGDIIDRGEGMPCQLVGECYIHEGMDGQLEGELEPGAAKIFIME